MKRPIAVLGLCGVLIAHDGMICGNLRVSTIPTLASCRRLAALGLRSPLSIACPAALRSPMTLNRAPGH